METGLKPCLRFAAHFNPDSRLFSWPNGIRDWGLKIAISGPL
jgi:hypothetical protein